MMIVRTIYEGNSMNNVSRRSVAKGAAWSVPAVTIASAAEAVAASGCTPRTGGGFGTHFSYGTIYSTRGNTTTQQLTLGGKAFVNSLPDGVTVTKVTMHFWFEARAAGQTGPGAPWMGASTSDKRGSCGSGVCSVGWTPESSGFEPTVTSATSNSSQTYPDGTVHPSWDATMTWDASRGPGTYTTNANGCQDFSTGESGSFVITYSGVAALSTADVDAGKKTIPTYVTVTATLSNGQVLTRSYQTAL